MLVDTSPDLREQLLAANVAHLDGVLMTHPHADQTNGIDDLKEIRRATLELDGKISTMPRATAAD